MKYAIAWHEKNTINESVALSNDRKKKRNML